MAARLLRLRRRVPRWCTCQPTIPPTSGVRPCGATILRSITRLSDSVGEREFTSAAFSAASGGEAGDGGQTGSVARSSSARFFSTIMVFADLAGIAAGLIASAEARSGPTIPNIGWAYLMRTAEWQTALADISPDINREIGRA